MHSDDGPVFGAFDGFDYAVGRAGGYAQARPGFAHGLVVEGVDGEAFAQQLFYDGAGLGVYKVGGFPSWSLL